MPEKTMQNKDSKKAASRKTSDLLEETGTDNWSEDQQKRSYYYDDGYGYEVYQPDADENDTDD